MIMVSGSKNFVQIGKAAKDIQSTLESSLHNVAENIEGAFVTLGEGSTDKSGQVLRYFLFLVLI